MKKNEFQTKAFSRNIGLFSIEEQAKLHECTIGLAGLGGVGGSYALSLARMGLGGFFIADFDTFDYANINRQAGAMNSTIGKNKAQVLRDMILDINPHARVRIFEDGITDQNREEFVRGSDIVIDAIDFFSIETHRRLHAEVRSQNKVSIFSVPAGQSGTLQVYHPQKMSFDAYYDFKDSDDGFTKLKKFAVGMAPAGLHLKYMDFTPQSLIDRRPTSMASGVSIAAGLVSNSVAMILLNHFKTKHYAPCYIQMDARLFSVARGHLWFGNRGPIQRIKMAFLAHKLKEFRDFFNEQQIRDPSAETEIATTPPDSPILRSS